MGLGGERGDAGVLWEGSRGKLRRIWGSRLIRVGGGARKNYEVCPPTDRLSYAMGELYEG